MKILRKRSCLTLHIISFEIRAQISYMHFNIEQEQFCKSQLQFYFRYSFSNTYEQSHLHSYSTILVELKVGGTSIRHCMWLYCVGTHLHSTYHTIDFPSSQYSKNGKSCNKKCISKLNNDFLKQAKINRLFFQSFPRFKPLEKNIFVSFRTQYDSLLLFHFEAWTKSLLPLFTSF